MHSSPSLARLLDNEREVTMAHMRVFASRFAAYHVDTDERKGKRMDRDLLQRYRWHRSWCAKYSGGLETATLALRRARAEIRARDLDLEIDWEPEAERYVDVYGEEPPKGVSFYTVAVHAPEERYLASLGFVDDVDRDYGRTVEADLLDEAIDTIDERNDREWSREAEVLAARATYAGVAS